MAVDLAGFTRLVRDKAISLTLFGGVLFYAVLYPLPYLHQVPTEQQLVVVDHDNSSLSRRLIRHADASARIQVVGRVAPSTKPRPGSPMAAPMVYW